MSSDASVLAGGLAGYAARLHATAGDRHHVVSPLGAWLLLALAAPAARGTDRGALGGVLGCDPGTAAGTAAALLEHPHPLVGCATAAWTRPGAPLGPAYRSWQAGLPSGVATGPLPGQAGLNEWAREHSFGMIEGFPVELTQADYLVLASALATRVSWTVPFELAPASELGPGSAWSRLGQVLRVPRGGQAAGAHRCFIAATGEAGDAAVHLARAGDGLLVASVAAPDAGPAAVLAAAQRIGSTAATGDPVPRRALADLPLGEAPLWRIREEQARDSADRFTAVLPAWSARTRLALDDPGLGFGLAARALAGPDPWQAAQEVAARYTRTGFEAAAVTSLAVAASARLPSPGRRRVAELRFARPYAVVAVAADPARGPWHGVPVFSAWVTEPDDAAGQ